MEEQQKNQPLELNTFLRIQRVASSGGQAKLLIRSGQVFVNGTIETRLRRKLVTGDRVKVQEKEFMVENDS